MKLISSKLFLKHKKEGHIERPERIEPVLKRFKYEKAEDGEIHLSKVHTSEYVEHIKELSKQGTGTIGTDTYYDKNTYKVACYAAGAAIQSAKHALKGENAFALVRPPGHHAHPDWTGGFCIFNNTAIAATYCAEKGKKVLIIDIDIHRGDGTQECINKLNKDFDGKMYYLSFNQEGIFPGATLDEGKIRNIYLPAGITEEEYLRVMKEETENIKKKFKPDIIAISAGFDSFLQDKKSYETDLGCGFSLTGKTITELKKIIGKTPYFAVLEGGYNPKSVLEGVTAFIKDES